MVGVGEGGPCLNIPTSVATPEPLSRLYFQLQAIMPDRTIRHVLISPKRATISRSLVCPYVSIKVLSQVTMQLSLTDGGLQS